MNLITKIKTKLILSLIIVLAIYVWFKMSSVMITGLSVIILLMSFSTIVDLFKKDSYENKKDKL